MFCVFITWGQKSDTDSEKECQLLLPVVNMPGNFNNAREGSSEKVDSA